MDGRRWLHRYAILLACATFLLVIAGGLVTSTGSGLAVPDWPLSFGQVFPRMEGGVFFEHGHRMVATAIGILTIGLAVWTARVEPRRWVRALGWTMLGAVILQGILGGATVLLRLPDAVSVAHAGLAQIFFAMTVVMADVSGAGGQGPEASADTRHAAPGILHLFSWTAFAIYAQILLGAIVRHTGAGLVIPTFPLANGRVIPEFTSALVAWQFAHRVFAIVVAMLVIACVVRIFRRHGSVPALVRPAALLIALLGFQVFLGALTIWTYRAVTPTTAHVATGALLFVTSVMIAVRAQSVFGTEAVPAEPSMEPVSR